MQLRISSILKESDFHFRGKLASVVFLSGEPFKSLFLETDGVEVSVESLYRELSTHSKKVDGIVFTGGEPLLQANSLRKLFPLLKGDGFLLKLETSGFYPEALRDLLPFLDYVQFDVKTRLEPELYCAAVGKIVPGEVILSKVLCSLAFLENSKFPVFKEFSVKVMQGNNDDFQTIESIASYVKKYCDLFTLRQVRNGALLQIDAIQENALIPKERVFELAMMARNILPLVAVETIDGKFEQLK